jgi:hypothetical protein
VGAPTKNSPEGESGLEDNEVLHLRFRNDNRVETVQTLLKSNRVPELDVKLTPDMRWDFLYSSVNPY